MPIFAKSKPNKRISSLSKNWFTDGASSNKFGKFNICDARGAVAEVPKSLIVSGGATAIPNPALGGFLQQAYMDFLKVQLYLYIHNFKPCKCEK